MTPSPACVRPAVQSCADATAKPEGRSAAGVAGADSSGIAGPLDYFGGMVDRCYDAAEAAHAEGRPIVGIMCEYTPREIILAAGALPVCLCGGSAATIPAAEQELPVNLCPLIKSTYGYAVKGTNPFLNWADLVVAETTCDGKKKMFELLGEKKPMYVLELPQKADDADGCERWLHELRKFRAFLADRYRVKIGDEKLADAIALMNRERRLRRGLAATMRREAPPLTGRQLLECKSLISGMEPDLEQYEALLRACGEDGDQRHAAAEAPPTASRAPVRVLLTGVPLVHGAERVLELIEACGAIVVAMENCTGLKPILEDVDEADPDPLRALARKYHHLPCSVLMHNDARLESLRTLAAQYRPQCIIEIVWQACLTYDIESVRVRRLAEQELRLPYLKITTDYAPSDSARIAARVEALFETIRARLGRLSA